MIGSSRDAAESSHEGRDHRTRALVVSLNTYSAPFNDGKLAEIGQRTGGATAVAGDVETMWDAPMLSRKGDGYEVVVLETRFAFSAAMARLRGLRAVAARVRPTVLHVECEPWQGVALQSIQLAREMRIPVGVQFAENGPRLHGPGGALRRLVGGRVLSACSYAIGWSSGSTEVALKLAPGIRTITQPGTGVDVPPGPIPRRADCDRWFGEGSHRCAKLAFVGRFSPEKGLDDFLRIADGLSERISVRVAIAGGTSSDPMVRTWLAERPWARVHGVISRHQVADLLVAADVLVCPSRTTTHVVEQFGKVPVEAMALGRPVFAYDCGALREVVGRGGIIMAEGNAGALIDALERYFRSSEVDRSELALEARAQASRFSNKALAEALIGLWADVGADAGPPLRRQG